MCKTAKRLSSESGDNAERKIAMRTKTVRIVTALLAIVMLGGCTGTGAGAGGTDSSNAGRSRTRKQTDSSAPEHDQLIAFS